MAISQRVYDTFITARGGSNHLLDAFKGHCGFNMNVQVPATYMSCVSDRDFGTLGQVLHVLDLSLPKEDKRAMLQKIVSADGLMKNEQASRDCLNKLAPHLNGIPSLARYEGKLLTRYINKCVDVPTLAMIAITQWHPTVLALILASRIANGNWTSFADECGCDEQSIIGAIKGVLNSNNLNIDAACAMWPNGPFADLSGGHASPTVTVTPSPAITPQALAAAHQAHTAHVQSVTGIPATPVSSTIQGAQAMSAAITVNPSVKPLIDGVLTSAGIGYTIDQIIAEITQKAVVEGQLAAAEKMAAETIDGLQMQLAAARSAAPITAVLTSTHAGIPDGKVDTVPVGDVFKMLKEFTLNVPKFTWDAPHPYVPEIDPNYIFRKEMLLKTVRCLARGENFWLQGHTGSGKTTFVEQIAAHLGWPILRVAFDSNVDRSELVGRMSLKPDGKGGTASEWLPGVLETAMAGGYILLCDEIDAGHPNSLYTIQPILEGKALTLLEDGGRIVNRSQMFRICATGNTTGNGDPSGMYPACRILSAATLDRFSEFVNVPYMTTEEEMGLLERVAPTLKKATIKMLAKFGNEMRQAFIKLETPITYSPRRSMAFARAVEEFRNMGIKDEALVMSLVFRSKLYDAAPDEHRQRITEIASNVLGGVQIEATLP